MKKALSLLPILVLLFALGCFRIVEVNEERHEFQREIQSQIDRITHRIEEARARAEELPHGSRAKLDETIAELEARKATLENKLDAMKSASDDEWQEVKVDVERASQDLESAFINLQEAFEEAFSEI